jgi:signal transduction histidine kinase/ActR/RegA family two-component response regulator
MRVSDDASMSAAATPSAANPARDSAQPRGLAAELATLILLAVLPLVAFSLGVILWGAWLQQRSIESGLTNTASALSLAVSRELAGWKATLRAIAVMDELEDGNIRRLHARVEPLAADMGGWIVLFDPDGKQLMNTIAPWGSPLKPAADVRPIERVVASQESTASDLFIGNNAKRGIVVVYEPVIVGGAVKYVLGLGIDPERLSSLLAVQPLPNGWYSAVTDSTDRVIARSVAASEYTGQVAADWFVAREKSSGRVEGLARDGTYMLVAFEPLRSAPWTVSVAVPKSLIARDQRLALALLSIGALLLLALAIWMSGRVATRIAAPVLALAHSAEQGVTPTRTTSGVREVQELERALVRAAEVERERSSERERRLGLEAANRAKDEFLATLSHELRTPLQAALGWLHVLRLSGNDKAARDRAVPVIERSLHQLVKLVNDLIDASRIVSGKVALHIEPVDLAPLVRQTAEAWQPAIAAKGQRLVVHIDKGTCWVDCDRARMAQVLSNLLANSVKFTPTEGRIDVRLLKREGRAEISVSDSGDGIDATALPNIFNKFWQAEVGSARRYQGLGLGLAIVKSLIELQGGKVAAASEGPGRGSTFSVSLPCGAEPQVSPLPARAQQRDGLVGARVLLVDDDADAGSAVAQLLSLQGAEVTLANSVREAMAHFETGHFDIALSDIAMPEQDGFDLLRAARRYDPKLPVVALTAYAAERDRQRAHSAGFDGFLPKPVDPDALQPVIDEARRRRASLVGDPA